MKLTGAPLTIPPKLAADRLTDLKLRQYERIISGRQFTEPMRRRYSLPTFPAPRIPKEEPSR